MDCIFCRISRGEVPSEIVYQDQDILAIRDINPQAPTHILIMPRQHIPTLAEVPPEGAPLLGRLLALANQLALQEGVAQDGYRLIINNGRHGGQEVPHLHVHLLGGRQLGKLG